MSAPNTPRAGDAERLAFCKVSYRGGKEKSDILGDAEFLTRQIEERDAMSVVPSGEYVSADLIAEAYDNANKLSFCEARIKRVVEYLETDPAPDNRFVINLLQRALAFIQQKAGT